jgi:uncharacterized protein (TIGR00299 family) protein
MAKFAYFDCLSGIAGDMTLAALIDAGADQEQIQAALVSLGLPELQLHTEEVKKCGFRALHLQVKHPPEHAHRHLHHITEMIDGAGDIDDQAKTLAKSIFQHVAVAEAKVHGTTLRKVHFHEVGAIDSIADIVGVAVAITSLGITSAMASPVPVGSGQIVIDHGRVSVPAPATAEILQGVPLAASGIQAELTTPTGAAIIKQLAADFGPLPPLQIESIGYGAGTADFAEQPNLLRILIGQRADLESMDQQSISEFRQQTVIQSDSVAVLETNLDDANGEQIADCVNRLFDAGALDVTQTPCTMKKGRPGVVLSVIAPPELSSKLESVMFRFSPTIGLRKRICQRSLLPRQTLSIDTPWGKVPAKSVQISEHERRIKVEHDDACRLADQHDLTPESIRRYAEGVALSDNDPGEPA